MVGCVLQGRILLGPEGIPVQRVDVPASNGVIHMLEGILLPPTILPILPKHCDEEQHQTVLVSPAPNPGSTLYPDPIPRTWAGDNSVVSVLQSQNVQDWVIQRKRLSLAHGSEGTAQWQFSSLSEGVVWRKGGWA